MALYLLRINVAGKNDKARELNRKAIRQRLERLRREQYKLHSRNEHMHTHLMCQMAGYVLTDILNYKEENLYNFEDFSLKKWQQFCLNHKHEFQKCKNKNA